MSNQPLLILIVANKTWECDPLVAVLLAKDSRPDAIRDLVRGYGPGENLPRVDPETGAPPRLPPEAEGLAFRGNLPIRPRLSFAVGSVSDPVALVEVWCVEDWMRSQRHVPTGTRPASGSSSYEKFTVALPLIRQKAFLGQSPGLVIAFGTAGIPTEETFNGCVTIGSRAYLNDPWDDGSPEEVAQQTERFGPLLQDPLVGWLRTRLDCPRLSETLFATGISAESRHAAEARFLEAPVNPARPPRILAGHGYASLGTINICDYDDYIWADDETRDRFDRQVKQREIGSCETTHGLIRLTWHDAPFLFVSALTDRVPYFNAEVTPRKYSQNFVPAHNAGVALAHLLPELGRLARVDGGLFSQQTRTIASESGHLPQPSWRAAPQRVDCPRYAEGETGLDCPWAGLARQMVAGDARQVLRDQAKSIEDSILADKGSPGCLESWAACLNFDELALAPIVDPAILGAITALAGLSEDPPGWHAGLTHTYGYLFSLLRTAFGYKRSRWVSPALEVAFGLPRGLLGPTPKEGTLLSNVTWLFGQLAFAQEKAPLARLGELEERVPVALRGLRYDALRRHRIVEAITPAGADGARIECRTDLVELPVAGTNSHLLVYSIHDERTDGARLVTGFLVGSDQERTLVGGGAPRGKQEVRTRYNAYVPGLTQMGSWHLHE